MKYASLGYGQPISGASLAGEISNPAVKEREDSLAFGLERIGRTTDGLSELIGRLDNIADRLAGPEPQATGGESDQPSPAGIVNATHVLALSLQYRVSRLAKIIDRIERCL